MASSTGTSRVVALIDMDCFYVQVEERDDPTIKGKPAAVVQYKAYKGGGIIAVNYEARAKGVTRNMRGDDAKGVCSDIILVRVPEQRGKADLTKYRDAGRDVINVLSEFSPCVERASVDEAYIDLTALIEERIQQFNSERDLFDSEEWSQSGILNSLNMEHLKCNFVVGHESTEGWLDSLKGSELPSTEDLKLAIGAEIIGKIREAVFQKTGFRCSAGIAHNKVIAKLCCGMNKPNKQTVLPHSSVDELWSKTKIKKVRNLGGKLGDFLVEVLKCELMSDLGKLSEKDLSTHLGSKTGNWLYQLCRGYDDEPVNPRELPKSIGCSKNFNGREALTTKEKVKFWVNQLAAEVVERIQRDYDTNNRRAKTLTLHVSFEKGTSLTRSCKLNPQYNQERLSADAFSLLDRVYSHLGFMSVNNLSLSATNFEDESRISAYAKIDSFFATKPNLNAKPNFSTSSSTSTSTALDEPSTSRSDTPLLTSKLSKGTLEILTPPSPPGSKAIIISKNIIPATASTSTSAAKEETSTSEEPAKRKPFFVYSEAKTEDVLNKDKSPKKKVSADPAPVRLYNLTDCERCGSKVPLKEYVSHMDHHTARDLSREINGLPPLGFDLRPETLAKNEYEKEKKEREQKERDKGTKRTRGGGTGSGSRGAKRGKASARTPEKLQVKTIDKYFSKS